MVQLFTSDFTPFTPASFFSQKARHDESLQTPEIVATPFSTETAKPPQK
ncbi:MAG: hypothetical protein N2747_05835 [Chitinophagaceae bacterium]|nr:hypothetical protein [Chitinophagaceae bacterium]